MPYVHTADGTAISHTSWGDGPPVLLVHSWGFNADMWTYQVPELVDGGARVVTTDRRGHGRSDRPGTGYDLDTLADDIAAVMARLDLRDVTMVGHSLGCSELVRCLTRHGTDRVSRLVLVAPVLPCLARMPDNPDGIDPSALAARAEALRSDVARWCADNTAGFFGEAKVSGELEAWLVRQIVGTPLKVLLDTMAAVAADLRAELPGIDVPTVVVHGDADVSAPIDLTGRRAAALIPDARLVVYAGAGHGLFASHHGRLNRDILDVMGLAPRDSA